MANFKTLKVRGSFKASRLIGNADTATVILDNELSTSGSITLASLDPGKYSYNHSTSGVTITDHPSPGNDFFLEVIPVDLESNIKRQIIHTMASLKTLDETAQTPVVYERNINYNGIGSRYRLSGYGKIHFTAVSNGHYEVNGISVSSDTEYYVALGTSVTIKAIADENYRVTSFTVNGHAIENTYTTTVTGLDNFSMSTSIDAINISITQPTGATISVRYDGNDYTSSFSMTRNKPIVITITPTEKYNVNALYWNGVSISSGSTQTPTEDSSITADVSIKRISVELPTSISNGSVSAIANGTTYTNSFVVDYGTKITINATANTGYHLNSLKNGSDNITSGTILTATSTISISCSFVINIYTVNITQPDSNGTITVTSAGEHHTSNFTVTHGTTITIVATPNTGYDFKSLLVNGNSFTSGDSMVVTGNLTLTGSVSIKTFTLSFGATTNQTYVATIGGTAKAATSSATSYTVNYGTSYSVVYNTAESSTAAYYYTASSSVSGTVTYNVSIPAKTATANLKYYLLTVPAVSNQYYTLKLMVSPTYGGILPSYITTATQAAQNNGNGLVVPYGTTYSITYSSPSTGYNVGASKSGTVTTDTIITHNAATLKTYTLTLNEVANGYWTVNGTNVGASYSAYYNPGTQLTVECFANEGYVKPTELTMS